MEPTEVEKLQQAKQVFKTRAFNRQQLEYILGRKLTDKTWQATYLRYSTWHWMFKREHECRHITAVWRAPSEANVNRQHRRPFASGASLSTRDLLAQTICRFCLTKVSYRKPPRGGIDIRLPFFCFCFYFFTPPARYASFLSKLHQIHVHLLV